VIAFPRPKYTPEMWAEAARDSLSIIELMVKLGLRLSGARHRNSALPRTQEEQRDPTYWRANQEEARPVAGPAYSRSAARASRAGARCVAGDRVPFRLRALRPRPRVVRSAARTARPPRRHSGQATVCLSQLSFANENVCNPESRVRGSGVTAAAQVLGTCARKGVGVRVPPSAPFSSFSGHFKFKIRTLGLCQKRLDTNSDTNWARQHVKTDVEIGRNPPGWSSSQTTTLT
jgi:hypothetical protein